MRTLECVAFRASRKLLDARNVGDRTFEKCKDADAVVYGELQAGRVVLKYLNLPIGTLAISVYPAKQEGASVPLRKAFASLEVDICRCLF